jgi:hypothetical protein
VSRFALHRQGPESQVCPRWDALACRDLTLVAPNGARLGHRRAGLDEQPATDGRNGSHRARSDRVATLGVR